MLRSRPLLALACAAGLCAGTAEAASVVFTSIGLSNGTEIFRADLSTLGPGTLTAITISDANALAGALGRFSGFDLDAIRLSEVFIATAAGLGGVTAIAGFDIAGAVLTPGTQRSAASPPQALFGSSGSGVDDAIATLAAFDSVPASDATARGFISLGDNGSLRLPLVAPLQLGSGPLYLYIGETGAGERASGVALVAPPTTEVPEPASAGLLATAFAGLLLARRRRRSVRAEISCSKNHVFQSRKSDDSPLIGYCSSRSAGRGQRLRARQRATLRLCSSSVRAKAWPPSPFATK